VTGIRSAQKDIEATVFCLGLMALLFVVRKKQRCAIDFVR
jgi:hypothetical protein